jgi:LPS export ABC transporter protein LptC
LGNHLNIAKPVALLFAGSAILLFSCKVKEPVTPIDEETVVARVIDSMTTIATDNGRRTQRFFTPLVEDYDFAKEPFSEYRRGIEVITYDSLGVESSNVVADYALHWTKRDFWELKGNVKMVGSDGRKLFTQQLFWDRKTKRIYSNVDSKVEEGEDVFIGEGFEAEEDMARWTFRRLKGRVSVDVEPTEPTPDSLRVDSLGSVAPLQESEPAAQELQPILEEPIPVENR